MERSRALKENKVQDNNHRFYTGKIIFLQAGVPFRCFLFHTALRTNVKDTRIGCDTVCQVRQNFDNKQQSFSKLLLLFVFFKINRILTTLPIVYC